MSDRYKGPIQVKNSKRKEEYAITFTEWTVFGEYRDPVDTISLSANFVAVLPEVESLLNTHVEWKLIPNKTTQYNTKVL